MAEPDPEQRVRSERVYDGRVVRLDLDTVRLRDGRETLREVVRHPGAALIIALDAEENVLLIRQFRYCVGGELLEAPAGTLDAADPTPLDCARRELAEETGYGAETWVPLGRFFTTPGFTTEVIYVYLANDLHPEPGHAMDEDEQIELVRMPLRDAVALATGGGMVDAKTIAGLSLAAAWLARDGQS